MSSAGASVRARHLKSIVDAIVALPPGDAQRVLARVPEPTRRAVADATSIDWLPIRLNLELADAVHDALGAPRYHRFFLECQLTAFSGPLLKLVVEAGLRVLRLDAPAFVGWIGKGWNLVFRECGTWVTEAALPGEAQLRLERLPAECARHAVWLRGVGHALDALWPLAGTTGAFTLVGHDPDACTATYRLAWR
jgi:hypothetical protein